MSAISMEERALFVGASESPALPGIACSPYTTPFELWHRKARNILADDLESVERVQAGQYLEPAIAAWAGDKFSMQLKPVNDYDKHPTIGGMGASLDFETESNREPVEIKNVDGLVFRDSWVADGDTIVEAPLHILVQIQHQMAVRPDVDKAWLIVCVGGNQLKRMEVPRHGDTIHMVESAVLSFWESISRQEPPEPDYVADASAISTLYSSSGNEVADMSGISGKC